MANKKTKIMVGVFMALIIVTAVSATLFGSGNMFKGFSLIASTRTAEQQIPAECGINNVQGLIPAQEPWTWWGIEDELCTCDASAHWIINPSVPTGRNCGTNGESACLRLEQESNPCICSGGYIEENFKCIERPVETSEGTTTLTEDYERAGVEQPSDSSDSNVDQPLCIFTSPKIDYCTANGQCIENSHLVQNRCQCDTGYEYNDSNFKCERPEGSIVISSNLIKPLDGRLLLNNFDSQQDEEDITEEAAAAEEAAAEEAAAEEAAAEAAAAEEAAAEAEAEEAAAEKAAAEEAAEKAEDESTNEDEAVVSCDDLETALSTAFNGREWELYETVLKDLEDEECFEDTCTPKFYRAILYISLRDFLNADLYYNDENCANCEWYTDLSGYASNDMSELDFNDPLLRDLAKETLGACPPPGSYDSFLKMIIDAADLFSSKYFDSQAKDINRKLAFKSFPTAYAQSVEFTDDVENVLEEEYNAIYGTETQVQPEPKCRSLNIVKPEYFQVTEGQKIIEIPTAGFSNQELAIVLDSDPGAVSLFRYKSMEGTITFDNNGTVLDTDKTSVYMNSTDTSKGDIVTVWAMDETSTGIQECHDALYVKIPTQPAASVATATNAAPVVSTVPAPVAFAAPILAAPAPVAYQYVHTAAPEVPKNGPGVILYIAGAFAGAFIIKRKKN